MVWLVIVYFWRSSSFSTPLWPFTIFNPILIKWPSKKHWNNNTFTTKLQQYSLKHYTLLAHFILSLCKNKISTNSLLHIFAAAIQTLTNEMAFLLLLLFVWPLCRLEALSNNCSQLLMKNTHSSCTTDKCCPIFCDGMILSEEFQWQESLFVGNLERHVIKQYLCWSLEHWLL